LQAATGTNLLSKRYGWRLCWFRFMWTGWIRC